ncbi:MAG: AMP-binding protein [Rhodospirillales bacterium]
MRIVDYFDATASRLPKHEAFVDAEARLDYGTAQKFVHAVAHALARDPELPVGAHIGVYSPNNSVVSLLQLGINRADRTWVLVHTRNATETNAQVLAYADTKLLFFHSSFEPAIEIIKQSLPGAKFVCMDRDSPLGPKLDKWLEGCWKAYPIMREEALGKSFMAPTGGTTGPQKAVVHTHRSTEISVNSVSNVLQIDSESRHLVVAPLTHAAGYFALAFTINGGTNVILPGFDPTLVLQKIAAERITHTYLPPTAIYALLAHPMLRQTDLSSLRFIVIGGSPIAPSRFKEAVAAFGPILYEMYGQTESLAPVTVKMPQDCMRADGSFDEDVIRSAGKAAPFMRVEIMDADGKFLPDGEPGEIVVLSSMVMKEYYKMPKETEEAQRFGWHHTTDIGVRDGRGFITIVDRIKDLIISGGLNIYPSEIEAVIAEVDGVLEASVIGVPDEKWGESVKAVVQLKPGRTVKPEDIIERCRARLGSLKVPRSVEFWDELPRSPVGKVLKREIRKKFWTDQWRAV